MNDLDVPLGVECAWPLVMAVAENVSLGGTAFVMVSRLPPRRSWRRLATDTTTMPVPGGKAQRR